MSAIDTLLNEAMNDGNILLTINESTRTLTYDGEIVLGVEDDYKAEKIYFSSPKLVGDGIDLSSDTVEIYIKFVNSLKETYWVQAMDKEVNGDTVTFAWLLTEKVTESKGNVEFSVCVKNVGTSTDENGDEIFVVLNEWHTTPITGTVLKGIPVDDDTPQIISEDPTSSINQYRAEVERLQDLVGDVNGYSKTEVNTMMNNKLDAPSSAGTKGAVLVNGGTGNKPVWTNTSDISVGKVNNQVPFYSASFEDSTFIFQRTDNTQQLIPITFDVTSKLNLIGINQYIQTSNDIAKLTQFEVTSDMFNTYDELKLIISLDYAGNVLNSDYRHEGSLSFKVVDLSKWGEEVLLFGFKEWDRNTTNNKPNAISTYNMGLYKCVEIDLFKTYGLDSTVHNISYNWVMKVFDDNIGVKTTIVSQNIRFDIEEINPNEEFVVRPQFYLYGRKSS